MAKISRFRLAAVASTTVVALTGSMVAAPSASALGIADIVNMLSSGGGISSNAPTFQTSDNPVISLGEAGGPLFNATYTSQVITPKAVDGAIAVRPGGEVTIRISATSGKDAWVHGLSSVVGRGFALKRVVVPRQNLLGNENAVALTPAEYATSIRGGASVATVSPKDKFLKLFDVPGKVGPGKTVFVDFVWSAPQQTGVYQTGGGLVVGSPFAPALISPESFTTQGGSVINVTNNVPNRPLNLGSVNLGSS